MIKTMIFLAKNRIFNIKSETILNTFLLLSILFLLTFCREEGRIIHNNSEPLFKLLESTETGIYFSNHLKESNNFNILNYRNFYNGGGVAIGDINNDGLPDLYFTSNQNSNKLYLNKGNFQFEDITEKAGVSGKKPWSTGVVMSDINGDGFLDIYVCNSGDVNNKDKENELYINNGDLTFNELAKNYNLNNAGYSTHAAFFDYDLDGDLDCYILNNSFKESGKIDLYKKVREQSNDPEGDKLMRNDGSIFTDVTLESGIYSSEIGFGLGVAVSDLNDDQLPDLYISNDFWERDYLYINLGNGKFSEKLTEQISYCSISSMGADIADINNDGYPEIYTTDMLPADNWRIKTTMAFDPYHLEDMKYRANFHYQMVQNCLQLNHSGEYFQEIAFMADVAASDWSWGALIFDFENDGLKDIFVSNGIARDIMSMDFRDFLSKNMSTPQSLETLKIIKNIPSNPLSNYAFKNTSDLTFKNITSEYGLQKPSFSNGAAYGDLDNDGDLDLVINNVNDKAYIYKNNTEKTGNNFLKMKFNGTNKNKYGIGVTVIIRQGFKKYVLQNFNSRGFQSSIEPQLLIGLGSIQNIEELTVIWPDKKTQILNNVLTNQTITFNYSIAKSNTFNRLPIKATYSETADKRIIGNSTHRENPYNDFDNEPLLSKMLSTEGPRIIMGDINNDLKEDFILPGASNDEDKLFLQQEDGSFRQKEVQAFLIDSKFESIGGTLVDFDKDGDLDLLMISGGNQPEKEKIFYIVRLYTNDGFGNFRSEPDKIPPVVGNFSTIEPCDIDNDGDMDLFLGARCIPGNYGLPPKSYLLENTNGKWKDITPEALSNVGMVTDATWADIDSDGSLDLIVIGDWMPITVFKNTKGKLIEEPPFTASNGWWSRIEPSDLDNDGDMDFIVGNWGLNSKFKASINKPLTMYTDDFDRNGKSEFIINWYAPLDSISYPFVTKMELTTQLPALRKEILKYESYGDKTFDSLFGRTKSAQTIENKTYKLESVILWNTKKGLILQDLPREAQVSPVYGIISMDFDNDGIKDIWLGGNYYALKPQVGRQNSNKGVLLKGNQNQQFNSILNNGLFVEGEVRDAVLIGNRILIARNNQSLLLFESKNP